MKRKDIRAGVVYAEVSAYGSPLPVVFLEDSAATVWLGPFNRHGNDPYMALRPSEKPHRSTSRGDRSQGYAAVTGPAEALKGLDCAAELAAFKARGKPSREGLRFELVFTLARISGAYGEAVTAYEETLVAERTARERAEAEAQALDLRFRAAVAGLAELGIRSRVIAADSRTDVIGLDVDNAEQLLAMLREKQKG